MGLDVHGLDLVDAARMSVLPTLGRTNKKVEVVAQRMGMAASTLYGILDRNAPLCACHVSQITRATGDDLLLQALCHQCGYAAIPIPDHEYEDASDDDVLAALAVAIQEGNDVTQGTIAAIRDGKITGQELRQFDKEFTEFLAAAALLRRRLVSMRGQ